MTVFRKFSAGRGEWEVSRKGHIRRISDGFICRARGRCITLNLASGVRVTTTRPGVVCEAWHAKSINSCSVCGLRPAQGKAFRMPFQSRSADMVRWAHERFKGRGTCQ